MYKKDYVDIEKIKKGNMEKWIKGDKKGIEERQKQIYEGKRLEPAEGEINRLATISINIRKEVRGK